MDGSTEIIEQFQHHMNENTPRIEKCLNQLSESQVWQKPNESSNSIGNLILHLSGNITQYVHSSLGKIKDVRERDLEFSSHFTDSKNELLHKISTTVDKANRIVSQLEHSELLETRSVQGFQLSGIGILFHVSEHYSYHTGQIALLTKLFNNQDLGFYKDFDLNAKNN